MGRRALRQRGALYAAGAVLAAVIGSWLGWGYGNRWALTRSEAGGAKLAAYLRTHIRGIEVGHRFPNVLVWSVDGRLAISTSDLLPDGGLVVFVEPGCSSCLYAADGLMKAVRGEAINRRSAILIASARDEIAEFADSLMARGINLPVYCDDEGVLQRDHHVTVFPTYFAIDGNGIVTGFGPAGYDSAMFAGIMAGG